MPIKQVRVLTLHEGQNNQHVFYRLEKGMVLRFNLGPTLHAKQVNLFCNHPMNASTPYEREKYHKLDWKNPCNSKSDRHDIYSDVNIVIAGSFNYYFTIDSSNDVNGSGYFLIDPTLSVGADNEEITLDCLQVQTVLTKLLGPFEEWEGRLRVAKETGYNMVHFTPIQELGRSNSSYSIADQLKFNQVFSKGDKKYTFDDVEKLVQRMNNEWNVLSLTDLVYNHSADNSPWLLEHPECAYNLENSPYLKPAFFLDRVLYHFSNDVAAERWVPKGIDSKVEKEAQLETIRKLLMDEVIPKCKIHEFHTVDVEDTLKQFKYRIEENKLVFSNKQELEIYQDPEFRRGKSCVDMDAVMKLYNIDRPGCFNREERIKKCCDELQKRLEELNGAKKCEMADHVNTAVNNFIENIRWRFLNPAGPKIGTVTKKEPLMHTYFIIPSSMEGSLEREEDVMNGKNRCLIMASNGWVLGDDPLKNFAEPGSNIYLRRELISWGDSCKLRYGKKPEDCPYLWDRMKKYTEITARIFHGIRLDNCHSTPIHVAEYMLDAARKIRPDLYVVAELFTGGENIDNIFINRLGINSLIREALSAWDAHEEGRLVHRYGGLPVGSFVQPRIRPLVPTVAHALFFDQTHDNESPIEKRSVYDLFPSTALVSMACCASGSNRGYDQLVPHHIHVVTEERKYTTWADWDFPDHQFINHHFGITAGKKILNNLHYQMGTTGFTQVYVDQLDPNVVSVTRHNPHTHQSILLVARTAFQKQSHAEETGYIRPLTVQGCIDEILFEGRLVHTEAFKYTKDPDFVNGFPNYYLELKEHLSPDDSTMVKIKPSECGSTCELSFIKFTPGSVIAVRTSLPTEARNAVLEIRRGVGQFGYLMRSYSGHTMFDESWDKSNFRAIVSHLTLNDLNRVLFRCDAEERDDGKGFGAYCVPGSSPMVFCGLRGVMSMLGEIRPHNDLGHALCGNLRDGDWLPGYMVARLQAHPRTKLLGNWFENIFKHLSHVPRYLIPCYFDAIVTGAYVVLRESALGLMSDFVQDGSTFVQALSLGSIMFCGFVKSSKLPPLSPNLAPPKPPTEVNDETGREEEAPLSLCAGLPHFANCHMRNWGRDTFIALRGLLLLTGRYQEARYIILAYAGCLRHGLIPNLLDKGTHARYNCRDAIWWWLSAIQEFCRLAPDGGSILKDIVLRMYPTDDTVVIPLEKSSQDAQKAETDKKEKDDVPTSPKSETASQAKSCEEKEVKTETKEQPLFEVIQEALQRHAEGLKYRERNAGPQIDQDMSDEGFNIEIGVRWETGFVFGGNEVNCGSWMDKMGSSHKAGTKGKPATPRNGSAVELIGLSKSALTWLYHLNCNGQYPYDGVTATENGTTVKITFKEWGNRIQASFEKHFWVNDTPDPPNEPSPEMITRRGMFKDSHYAKPFWADFQLRPNFAVAMVAAPELFNADHAWKGLTTAQEVLLGPLGMKTLDPRDWSYCGDYDNSNDSEDGKVAHGFNYHQGPEWVWPIGYFLRAKLHFAQVLEKERPGILAETVGFIKTTLTKHYEVLMGSPWRSLPELTNSNGSFCRDSCAAQAWSVGGILEVLYDLEKLELDRQEVPYKEEAPIVAPV